MSEIEKLRALLAEARRVLGPPCHVESCGEVCVVVRKIDAALAEPAQEDEALRVWKMVATQKQAERDEARAECVRLKIGWDEAHALSDWLRHEEMLRVEQLAFERGAEAMREAAARKVLDSNPRVPLAFVAHDVRVMDVPEDKADDA